MCTICSSNAGNKISEKLPEQQERVYQTHAALQAHITNHHPPTCAECTLQCSSQSALKSHMEVVHGGFDIDERRVHICQEPGCGRGFTKKGNLNAHVQIDHTGKRFICGKAGTNTLRKIGEWNGSDACGEAFRSKANLEKHIRGVHLGLGHSGRIMKRETQGFAGELDHTPQVSTLTRLTGAGYETESGRVIGCLVQHCSHRFRREYDLEIHLQSQHGLADFEIQDLLVEDEFDKQPALHKSSYAATKQCAGALSGFSLPQNEEIEMYDIDEGPGDGVDSWRKSVSSLGGIGSDPWPYDAMGVQSIVHGYHWDDIYQRPREGDVDMVDPTLF